MVKLPSSAGRSVAILWTDTALPLFLTADCECTLYPGPEQLSFAAFLTFA